MPVTLFRLTRWLFRFDGRPSAAAGAALAALVTVAFAVGFTARATRGSDAGGAAPLARAAQADVPPAGTAGSRPRLSAAAALPALRLPARPAPEESKLVSAEATPTATPTPSATPTPTPAASPAPVVPVSAPAPKPAPKPKPASGEIFDSSG